VCGVHVRATMQKYTRSRTRASSSSDVIPSTETPSTTTSAASSASSASQATTFSTTSSLSSPKVVGTAVAPASPSFISIPEPIRRWHSFHSRRNSLGHQQKNASGSASSNANAASSSNSSSSSSTGGSSSSPAPRFLSPPPPVTPRRRFSVWLESEAKGKSKTCAAVAAVAAAAAANMTTAMPAQSSAPTSPQAPAGWSVFLSFFLTCLFSLTSRSDA